ncbi:hypothetical protein RHA1_ro11141 (plasmid) [Rhodococcus jostii RHA1]|uniref:DUF1109 domain-containing protein n=1 Tax=Rhodococcus jostii (strain RHA1) TaxID=101510 RepID=Q0RV98_RHOJR|nr:hypothetical protein [Rhodococcus jostii]ABH00788.1 hypothetical protein RHA1_ro11141 [Rhodococcus jostii RHA1]
MDETLKRADPRSPRTLLWVVTMAVTAGALMLLIVVWGQWWPSGNAWYLPAAVAVALLLATGAVWALGSIYVLWKHRRWAWWMVTWPLLVALGVALALAARPDFEDSRPEFEETARQLLATPGPTSLSDLKIGRFEVGRAYNTEQGDVFFTDERTTAFTTESGWAYSPDGAPAPASRDGEFTTTHIDGPWYRYELVTTF